MDSHTLHVWPRTVGFDDVFQQALSEKIVILVSNRLIILRLEQRFYFVKNSAKKCNIC